MKEVIAGRYQVQRRLGSGGMATVHLAYDPLLGREVAIKVPRVDEDADPRTFERFRAELQAIGRLNHPNIVTVYDGGQEDGRPFLVMEPVEGESLAELLRRKGSLPVPQAVDIARQVAEALAYAHELGVVHRDVKPQNVLLDRQGRVKVTDFGIAKSYGDETRTLAGTVVGTPTFMAPEVSAGGPATARSDVYALGVVLYQMLTGHTPFEADNPIAIALRSQQEDPQPPSRLRPVPSWLDSVVLHALARDPEQRYPTAAEFAADLAEGRSMEWRADQTSTMVMPARPHPARKKRSGWGRRLLSLVVPILIVGAIGTAAVVGARYVSRIPPQPTRNSPPPKAGGVVNLLRNGDLVPAGNAQPNGWNLQVFQGVTPRYFWQPQGPAAGDHELGLSTRSATDAAWVGEAVSVQPGWKLTLTGYVKGTDVPPEGSGIALRLVCQAADKRETGSASSTPVTGSRGWEEAHASLTVPANTAACAPQLRLGEPGRPTLGTAEFSRISLLRS